MDAIDLRRGNWLAARICELLPADSFRRGFDVKITEDKETSEEIQAVVEEIGLVKKFIQAGQMERTTGGAALFPVLDGALGDMQAPLDVSKITTFRAVHLLEPRELMPMTWYGDITNPKFGLPETYRLWPLSSGRTSAQAIQTVHESRLAIFPGIHFTRELSPGNRAGWGDNVPRAYTGDLTLGCRGSRPRCPRLSQGVLVRSTVRDAQGRKTAGRSFRSSPR
jgi:hypothetical protein